MSYLRGLPGLPSVFPIIYFLHRPLGPLVRSSLRLLCLKRRIGAGIQPSLAFTSSFVRMSDSESSQDFRIDGNSESDGFIEPTKKVAATKKTTGTVGGTKAAKVSFGASTTVSSAGKLEEMSRKHSEGIEISHADATLL